jgi:deazaflavin-dependent oxidoreductase (nitroreductase family)
MAAAALAIRDSRQRGNAIGIEATADGYSDCEMSATKEEIEAVLQSGQTIDITTTGRRSGEPRRLEIVFHNIGGRIYISGMPFPKRRSWLVNLDAEPRFTFHLKGKVRADLPATARAIDEETERRAILPHIARVWGRKDIEEMVRHSPLIEVTIAPNGSP